MHHPEPFLSALTSEGSSDASTYVQTDLVSNISGLALQTDANLINPWGVSFLPKSPFWVSDNGANAATLYSVTGSTGVSPELLKVDIPTTASGPPQGPTGQVSNTNSSSFIIPSDHSSAAFIFANLNGTISAWNQGLIPGPAEVEWTTPGARLHGLSRQRSA